MLRGFSDCQKSLAEFAARAVNKVSIIFCRGVYLAEKPEGVFYPNMIMAAITCTARITGMPTVNFKCIVLWRTAYIPKIHPRLPPMMATVNSVASGMRQRFFFALNLSTSISRKPMALNIHR